MENYFIGLLGNVEIVEIIEELWNCGIHLHYGYVKKNYENCKKCMKWKKNEIVMKSESPCEAN